MNKLDPFLMDFNGNVEDDVTFKYEENTDLNGACTVLYYDKAWIFGGVNLPRQVINNEYIHFHISYANCWHKWQYYFQMSHLRGCELHRSANYLPVDFIWGSCLSVNNLGIRRSQNLVLCSYADSWDSCIRCTCYY